MTIDEAIRWLEKIKVKSGGELPLYFDCPKCEASFTPNRVVTTKVHVSAEPESKDAQKAGKQ